MIASEVHLLVMIHGLWGTPDNLLEVKKTISNKYASSLLDLDADQDAITGSSRPRLNILVAQTNQSGSTYDGIDWGGERVAEEVQERIARLEKDGLYKVTAFSIFGYSLGGLLARYLLGILHSRNFFKNVKPINFTTVATPHIGIPRYPTLLATFSMFIGRRLLSRTGEQLYCRDTWGKERRAILEVMADKERIFWRALSLFPNVHIYANSVNDPTVPFITAAIESVDPFIELKGLDVKLDPAYGALVESYEHASDGKSSTRKKSKSKPFLPPFLKRGLLFETTLLVFSPVLIPTALSLAVLWMATDSHASRARVRMLESDVSEQSRSKLVNIWDSLEHTVRANVDQIIDEIDHNVRDNDGKIITPPSIPPDMAVSRAPSPEGCTKSSSQPILTDAQRKMVHTLNQLPRIHKHFAFFNSVRNSHGLIICREAAAARRVGGEWEELTQQGEGVLRHWADGFVLVIG